MEKVTNRQWYTRIDDTLILGALPFKSVARELLEKENVKGVISMNEDYELYFAYGRKEWEKHGVKFLQLKTTDYFETPCQDKLVMGVQFIKEFKRDGSGSVYVHCKAGRTRSALLVLCYMVEDWKIMPVQAVESLTELRRHVLLGRAQREGLQTYYENLINRTSQAG